MLGIVALRKHKDTQQEILNGVLMNSITLRTCFEERTNYTMVEEHVQDKFGISKKNAVACHQLAYYVDENIIVRVNYNKGN